MGDATELLEHVEQDDTIMAIRETRETTKRALVDPSSDDEVSLAT